MVAAYIRSTMGVAGIDARFEDYAAGAKSIGADYGFYHLFRPDSDGVEQARHAYQVVKNFKDATLFAVDVERVLGVSTYPPKEVYAEELHDYCEEIKKIYGAHPMIYTSAGEWAFLVGDYYKEYFGKLLLWVANFTDEDKPLLPSPWDEWVLWQYTSEAVFSWHQSDSIDLNRKPKAVEEEAEFTIRYPVDNPIISQGFGDNRTGDPNFYKKHGLPAHEGDDFDGEKGDLIYAAADGVVKSVNIPGVAGVNTDHPYGIHIKITHLSGLYETDYCHLSKFDSAVLTGKTVKKGQIIGEMGNSGNVVVNEGTDGVHLHFMLRKRGNTADGVKMQLADGSWALYKNDIVNPKPYYREE